MPSGSSPFRIFSEDLVRLVDAVLPRTASIWIRTPDGVSTGSGWCFDESHVVTNHHVVDQRMVDCRIRFSGQLEKRGEFVGSDPKTDLAVIRVDDPGVTPLEVRIDPQPRRGEFVMALGYPLEFDESVSIGIVSGLGRQVQLSRDVKIEEAIQTDATINSGNSGGPLVDLDGRLIGVNFASRREAAQINLAIPAEIVRDVVPELVEFGNVRRASLGVSISAVPSTVKGQFTNSVEVQATREGSQLRRGDIILAINGKKVTRRYDVIRNLNRSTIGKTVALVVFRNGQVMDLEVVTSEQS